MIQSYNEIKAWQLSMAFVTMVYRLTEKFPQNEMFGLTNQLRRAAVSVPSNIAEGFGRNSNGDFSHFLSIANGSLCEVETQLEIAKNLGFINDEAYNFMMQKALECGKTLRSFWKSVRERK